MPSRTPLARRNRDHGFTLIELLVVVIVVGLLAAIAIPVFLNQRKKGIDASLKSDLRSAAHAVEGWNADNTTDRDGPAVAGAPLSNYTAGSDTLASTIALPGGSSVKTSPGNIVTIYANSTGEGYCVAAAHSGSSKGWTRPGQPTSTQASVYDSTAGGITSAPSSGCALASVPAGPTHTAGTGTLPCPHFTVTARYGGSGPVSLDVTTSAVAGVDRYRYSYTSRLGTSGGNSTDPYYSAYPALTAGDTITVSVNLDDWEIVGTPDTAGCASVTLAVTNPMVTGSI